MVCVSIYRIWGVLVLEGGCVGFFVLSVRQFFKAKLSSLFFSSSRLCQVDQNFYFHNANIYSIAEIRTSASTNCPSSVWLAYTGRDLPEEGSTGHWELCMLPTRVLCRLQCHKLSLWCPVWRRESFAPKTTVYQVSFAPKTAMLVFMTLILQISQLKLLKRLKLNGTDMYILYFENRKPIRTNKHREFWSIFCNSLHRNKNLKKKRYVYDWVTLQYTWNTTIL